MAQSTAQKINAAKFKMAVVYRKKHPGMTLQEAFDHVYGKRTLNRTGANRVGKVAAKKKRMYKQTGSSVKALDKKIQAKKPGKRVTASGSRYTETRANRSDKGRLLGRSADNSRGAGHTATKTKADTRNNRTATKTITANVKIGTIGQVMTAGKIILMKKLGDLEAKKFTAKKKSDKNRFAREIREVKSQLRKFL